MNKTVRYTVSPNIPFADEMIKQLEKKGILYQSEVKKRSSKSRSFFN